MESSSSSWESNRHTASLVGTYVRELRGQHLIGVDTLAGCVAKGRTVEWLRAFERGEIMPTRNTLTLVSGAFDRACAIEPSYELAKVYVDLLDEPRSDLADALRSRTSPGIVSTEENQEKEIAGLKLYSAGLSEEDRLLGLFPALAAVILSVILVFSWGQTVGAPSLSISPALAALALGFLGSTVVVLVSGFTRIGDFICYPIHRISGLGGKHSDASTWASILGVKLDKTQRWHQPAFDQYVIPTYRKPFSETALAADFAERLCVVFAVAGLVSTILAVQADLHTLDFKLSSNFEDYAPGSSLALVAVLSFALALSTGVSAVRRGRSAHATLFRGLGLVEASKQSQIAEPATETSVSASETILPDEASQAPPGHPLAGARRQISSLVSGYFSRRALRQASRQVAKKHA